MNECKIVEDLLPLYAEDLTSEESGAFIREHAKSCERCARLLERCAEPMPEPEENPEQMKKALRRDTLKVKLKGIVTFVLVLAACFGPVIGLVCYYAWEIGELGAESSFVSELPQGGYYRVDVYDWDTAGFFDTGEGSIIKRSCSIRKVTENGVGYSGGSGTFYAPWENVQLDWAPNGEDSLVTADLVSGGTEFFVLSNDYWLDETGMSHHVSRKYPGNGYESGIRDILLGLCRKHPDFPTGWEEIRFTFHAWGEDSETLTFIYETDNGHRGFVDFHYPTETITAVD